MNGCEQYWELISAALDGALTSEEQARLEAHLAQCPECREMLADLRSMETDLRRIEQPSAGFADRVMAQAAQTEQDIPFTALPQNREPQKMAREQIRAWWKPFRTIGALAACCLLILGVGAFLSRSGMLGAHSAAPEAEYAVPAAEEAAVEEAAEEAGTTEEAAPGEAPEPEMSMPASDMAEDAAVEEEAAPAEDAEPAEAAGPACISLPEGDYFPTDDPPLAEPPQGFGYAGESDVGAYYADPEQSGTIYVETPEGFSCWKTE